MKITESQGTKCYLVDESEPLSTSAEIETAILSSKEILFIPTLGDIGSSKSVTSYSFINTSEVAKSIGSRTLPNFNCDLIYDASDTQGQNEIKEMYKNNTRRNMIISIRNSYIIFKVAVSALNTSVLKDSAVMAKSVIEMCSIPVNISVLETIFTSSDGFIIVSSDDYILVGTEDIVA